MMHGEFDAQLEGAKFARWLGDQVVADATGSALGESDTRPSDTFWLGRLAPEDAAWRQGMGERGQRLDPCSAGFRFRPVPDADWRWAAIVQFRVWSRREKDAPWRKSDVIVATFDVAVDRTGAGVQKFGEVEIASALSSAGATSFGAHVEVEIQPVDGMPSLAVSLVNTSPEDRDLDHNLYEVRLALKVGDLVPFVLESLPDSFRYDRRVSAYGLFGGVRYADGLLETTDYIDQETPRPRYWDDRLGSQPDLRFVTLAADPVPSLTELMGQLRRWGDANWGMTRLQARAAVEAWSGEMMDEATREAALFETELARCEAGLQLLEGDVLRAFKLMNEAFMHSGGDRYDSWRPFQVGFLLSALSGLLGHDEPERQTVDTLWFATGGGKTETYLAAIVFAALYDRLRGKGQGITAWSRFPLRMLSLQQTQRFADALAGAELVRQRERLGGDPFSLGFFVGRGGTPNKVRDDPPADGSSADAGDRDMPPRYQVLLRCPFCHSRELHMGFDRRTWRLVHRCGNEDCTWTPGAALPFYVVDEEIFRYLPTAIVGTLDKAASLGIQAAMRGVYGPPLGRCEMDDHGFAYAPRKHTTGCLVPGCTRPLRGLGQAKELFAPTIRVQDELHLLRGGLGAIDSHYETLLDHLQGASGGPPAKILASSATLAGHSVQVATLYGRTGHAFPRPRPEEGASFWTSDHGAEVSRRFLGLAPRGQTLEFANQRTAESLQRAVRRLLTEPDAVCREAGVPAEAAGFLLDYYGTNVVYGNTVRDVDAAARSFETQPGVEPLNFRTLTGGTPLDEVRATLKNLEEPEANFADRLHVVCASSMMSHGVDIDRFNVITMLGLPLATAEFIQTTARIGRRFPGLVIVLHRMGVERDASVFRSFDLFVRHGERFIEPVAVTRKSKRVLDRTFGGLFMARVLGLLEPGSLEAGGEPLTTVKRLRAFVQARGTTEDGEFTALCEALDLDTADPANPLADRLKELLRRTFRELNDPASTATFPSEALPAPPMLSLREVETQIPIVEDLRR